MRTLNENIFHQYNKWKQGYERKENSLEVKLSNFISTNTDLYKISKDGKHVDVNGSLLLYDENLINGELPVPFGEVKQDCYIECPSLKSMKNAPKKIKGQLTFYNCPNLKSMDGYVDEVGTWVMITKCGLEHSNGMPKAKKGIYFKDCNSLTSLENCFVKGSGTSLILGECHSITSLNGLPDTFGFINIKNCDGLTNLNWCPQKINKIIITKCKNLTSLDIPNIKCDTIECPSNENLTSISINATSLLIFQCHECPKLNSLKGAPTRIHTLYIDDSFDGDMSNIIAGYTNKVED